MVFHTIEIMSLGLGPHGGSTHGGTLETVLGSWLTGITPPEPSGHAPQRWAAFLFDAVFFEHAGLETFRMLG
jgi:hypothetical protein